MKKLFLHPSICILSLCAMLYMPCAKAQDDLMALLEEDAEPIVHKVQATFKSIKIINAQTIETIKAKTLVFRITHRFDNIGLGAHSLYGLDNARDIRFSFDYGILDRLLVGFARSKINENIDGSIKYKLLEQTTDNKMSVTITLFSSLALAPIRENLLYPEADADWIKENKKFIHRFSYVHQVIIARKFSPRFSFEVLPTIVHRNFVQEYINTSNDTVAFNDLFSLGFAGRIKITKRTSLVFDYFYTFSDKIRKSPTTTYYAPLGIGVEIETGGHVFHINFTNSAGIIENDYIPNTTESWQKGDFKLGFNIARVFYL